jgi:HTH-type transcriptional regulator/antitoxin HigA
MIKSKIFRIFNYQTFSLVETVRRIKNQGEYNQVIEKIETLLDSKPNTPEFDLLEVLSILVDDYENKVCPMPTLDPIDAIKYEMEERGLLQKDLVPYIGSKSKVSEVLNRKTGLTVKMIKALYHEFGIPANVLLSQ